MAAPKSRSDARASNDNRDKIIVESARLFRWLGYHATSTSEISEATGLNKGTLYYYFPTKGDILFAVYNSTITELEKRTGTIDETLEPDALLLEYIKVILHTIRTIPDFCAVYFQERPWVEKSLDAQQAATIRAHEQEFTQRLSGVIAQGVKRKTFVAVDPDLLATQLLASAQSFYRWRVPKTKASVDGIAETMVRYVLEGIRRD